MTIEVTDAGLNEYEALVRDARRYRWLRARDVSFEGEDGMEFIKYIPSLGHDGSNLDAAIDVAMEAAAYKKRQEVEK